MRRLGIVAVGLVAAAALVGVNADGVAGAGTWSSAGSRFKLAGPGPGSADSPHCSGAGEPAGKGAGR
jgi:hypothetical protein